MSPIQRAMNAMIARMTASFTSRPQIITAATCHVTLPSALNSIGAIAGIKICATASREVKPSHGRCAPAHCRAARINTEHLAMLGGRENAGLVVAHGRSYDSPTRNTQRAGIHARAHGL